MPHLADVIVEASQHGPAAFAEPDDDATGRSGHGARDAAASVPLLRRLREDVADVVRHGVHAAEQDAAISWSVFPSATMRSTLHLARRSAGRVVVARGSPARLLLQCRHDAARVLPMPSPRAVFSRYGVEQRGRALRIAGALALEQHRRVHPVANGRARVVRRIAGSKAIACSKCASASPQRSIVSAQHAEHAIGAAEARDMGAEHDAAARRAASAARTAAAPAATSPSHAHASAR